MKKLMALLVICVFATTIVIPGLAKEATSPGATQKIDIKQLQETRKASQIPINRTSTIDLRCHIKAFYDQARTKPISGGIYDWGAAPYPKLIYYDITVENTAYSSEQGTKARTTKAKEMLVARAFNVKIDFITPSHSSFPWEPKFNVKPFTMSVTNLGPGESHVFSFQGPPPLPNKPPDYIDYVQVVANVDPENKVKEESETNNQCSYKVSAK